MYYRKEELVSVLLPLKAHATIKIAFQQFYDFISSMLSEYEENMIFL